MAAGLMTAGCSAACDPHLSQCEVTSQGRAGVVTRVLVTAQLSPLLCAPAAVTPGHQPAGNQQSRFYSSTCCSLIITRGVPLTWHVSVGVNQFPAEDPCFVLFS